MIVGIGAAIGAVIRVYLSKFNGNFPWMTLFINTAGSLILGCLVHDKMHFLLFGTGMMGGLTTFSTFSVETVRLWKENTRQAIIYISLSTFLPLASFFIGMLIL